MVASPDDRHVSEVLHDIFGNLQDIVRSEVRLVKAEVEEAVSKSTPPAISVAIGAVLACFAVFLLLLASVYALSTVMPNWAAALVVALGAAILGAIALSSGVRRLKQVRLAPLTLATSKENVSWSKPQLS